MKSAVTFLTFNGNCRQAMEFDRDCFGASLFLLPVTDAPVDAAWKALAGDRILHATLSKGDTILMAADSHPAASFQPGNNISVFVHCENAEELKRLFSAFAAGGTVTVPPQDMFWGARFGEVTDRFGVHWMFSFALPATDQN